MSVRHVPASHPVLKRAERERVLRTHDTRALSSPASRAAPRGPLASPQAHGLGLRTHQEDLIAQVEQLVELLSDAELPLSLLERYERALTRGHANNLARLRALHKE